MYFKQNKNIKKYLKFFIFAIIFFYNINIFQNYNNFFLDIYLAYQTKSIENYLNFLDNHKSKLIKSFKIINNPKISIVSPVFNRERYLSRFIRSIQYQNFHDVEIILVNDGSVDNTVKIIKNFRKKDERIKLVNIKKNKGTFISRNIGVLFSKGKYIILPDPDDIISKDILRICYNLSEKNNYEMIKFIVHSSNTKTRSNDNILVENKVLYQPEIFNKLIYIDIDLGRTDFSVCNKFMKKEVYIKTLNSINSFYLNQYLISGEDQLLNFMIYKTAKSLYLLKVVGYYYIRSSISITNNLSKISELHKKFVYIHLRFIFEYSKNNKYEKDICNHFFLNSFKSITSLKFASFNINKYNFYNNILEMYLNNDYITDDIKKIIKQLKIDLKNNFK